MRLTSGMGLSRNAGIGIFLSRVLLGLYFLLAGLSKIGGELTDSDGRVAANFGAFYRGPAYQGLEPDFLPAALSAPYGYALPWAELVIGLLLMLGLFTRLMGGLTFLMILSFLIAQIYSNGMDGVAPGPGPFNTNFILAAVSLIFIFSGPGRLALDHVLGRKKRSPASGSTAAANKSKPGPRL